VASFNDEKTLSEHARVLLEHVFELMFERNSLWVEPVRLSAVDPPKARADLKELHGRVRGSSPRSPT
jgi:hypothetical protein